MIDLSSPLDITTWRQTGQELHEAIVKECKGLSESLVFTPLPSKIEMNQAQYDDLMKLGNLPNMYHSESRMYITPYNVMEVRVSDRTRLTYKETQALDEKSFNEWEKSVEGEEG